mgnify:CR=1 FL=1
MKRKATDVLADVFIYVFMAVLSLLCLIPFIHVLSVSISGNGAVMSCLLYTSDAADEL